MRSMILGLAASALLASTAVAGDVKLPKQISWTAYGTTSSGYAQSVGLGNMLKEKYDIDLRIIPGNNDVSRMLPLKANQAEICACGIASYFGQEGVFMFADKKFGPMPLMNLFNNIGRIQEIGAWTAENQAATDAGLKRNEVLAAAWAEFTKTDVPDDKFEAAWLAARAKHLSAAGMAVPFAEPLGD